jgi:hypothetical protein
VGRSGVNASASGLARSLAFGSRIGVGPGDGVVSRLRPMSISQQKRGGPHATDRSRHEWQFTIQQRILWARCWEDSQQEIRLSPPDVCFLQRQLEVPGKGVIWGDPRHPASLPSSMEKRSIAVGFLGVLEGVLGPPRYWGERSGLIPGKGA